jgi:hypothetical protein
VGSDASYRIHLFVGDEGGTHGGTLREAEEELRGERPGGGGQSAARPWTPTGGEWIYERFMAQTEAPG